MLLQGTNYCKQLRKPRVKLLVETLVQKFMITSHQKRPLDSKAWRLIGKGFDRELVKRLVKGSKECTQNFRVERHLDASSEARRVWKSFKKLFPFSSTQMSASR